MATKTWKIGEYCKGGIIQVKTTKKQITVIGKDWDFSAGSNRGSNQSNAKEWTRLEVSVDDSNARRKLNEFIIDLTTSYYTDQIIEWIEKQVDLKGHPMFW